MNLEEQISAVLNDPEAMSKLSSIVGALGAGQKTEEQATVPALPSNPLGNIKLPDMSGDNRTKLLMAVKPFLSEKRAPYVDGAVAILRMMQLGKLGKDFKLF